MSGPPKPQRDRPARGRLPADEAPVRPRLAASLDRGWRRIEGLFDRAYGSPWNPLYKSGALAVVFIGLTLITGIYLFLFYKISAPYESVARIDAGPIGSWMRSVHRYSADLAVVAIALHALKMLLSGRTWGPRARAWITGVVSLGALLLCGWTGLVMAWDVQGQLVAYEGARLLDTLPLFSEPISRGFSQPGAVGRSFFFMNLFAHVALPLGLAALFWLHSSRVARPTFLPERPIRRYAIVAVALLAVAVPVPLPPKADLLAVPVGVPLDLFYAFWLPLARAASPGVHLAFWLATAATALAIPWLWRPRRRPRAPSRVDEDRCSGCSQCYLDCPYEAIAMIPRDEPSELSEIVARVDPALCVSCGLCAGSCAPMGVGPPLRTGRDQLAAASGFVDGLRPTGDEIVLIGCRHGLAERAVLDGLDGVRGYSSGCSGSVHTSVVELMLRRGAGGVFLLTCPGRDCIYREGPAWLHERLYNDREAELQERVDRRRVRMASFGAGEISAARGAIGRFRDEIRGLPPPPAESDVRLDVECEPVDVEL